MGKGARHRDREPLRRARGPGLRLAAVGLTIALGVAAIYGQTWNHAFLNYDDDVYVTANPLLTAGISWRAVAGAFGFHAANWHPLTWFSHMAAGPSSDRAPAGTTSWAPASTPPTRSSSAPSSPR